MEIQDKKTFTRKELITLLAAYALSDSGTHSVIEVKKKWPNSFTAYMDRSESWLNNTAMLGARQSALKWWRMMDKDFKVLLRTKNPRKFHGT